jgi:putative ABC transport system permease protein
MCGSIELPGGQPAREDAPPVCRNIVGPRFFETMGIPLLAGRDFDAEDDDRAPQRVVISENVARRYFSGQDPLGRQILVDGPASRVPAVVIGVVKDVRYTSLRVDPPFMIYRPYRQETGPANTFLVRTSSSSEALAPLLRAEVRSAAPALPPPSVVSLEDLVAGALVEERILAALSSALGAMAALLAAVGIYSTSAAAVVRRQREIGIRMALGARSGGVVRMVVGDAFGIVASGLAIGIPAAVVTALAVRAKIAGVLFELSPTDPFTLAGSVLAILALAAIASYLPARRASRIDPIAAVRCE